MILELVLTVCATVARPAPQCHDVRIKLVDVPGLTLIQCQMGSMPSVIDWMRAHPGWRVTAWTCHEYIPEKDI